MSKGTYKFTPYAEYNAHEVDEDGVIIYTNPLRLEHPNARANIDKTEVVISTNHHGGECGCVSYEEAMAHIKANWPVEDSL